MKKILNLIVILLMISIGQPVRAQVRSCCAADATAQFAMLGHDPTFRAAHAAPEIIHFIPSKGEMISFSTPDGKTGSAFIVRPEEKSTRFLFVFHEWWGLNDHIKKEAERFSDDFPGVNILAIDLYDGQLATNAEDAGKIMQLIQKDRAEAIIKGALAWVGSTASVQTVGWCFGGGWSLQAALLSGSQLKGCVIYYGMPEKDRERLSKLNAPVMGIYASRDGWVSKPLIDEFEKLMTSLKKDFTAHWFDAVHAFANPSNPEFDETATARARALVNDFLKKNWAE